MKVLVIGGDKIENFVVIEVSHRNGGGTIAYRKHCLICKGAVAIAKKDAQSILFKISDDNIRMMIVVQVSDG